MPLVGEPVPGARYVIQREEPAESLGLVAVGVDGPLSDEVKAAMGKIAFTEIATRTYEPDQPIASKSEATVTDELAPPPDPIPAASSSTAGHAFRRGGKFVAAAEFDYNRTVMRGDPSIRGTWHIIGWLRVQVYEDLALPAFISTADHLSATRTVSKRRR
jgi:hypothetical protein